MMRILFIMVLLAISPVVFSQAKKEIKVASTRVTEMKTLSDIISDIPKDCKVFNFVFSANINGEYKEYTCMGDNLPVEIKKMVTKMEKGKHFFVEKINSGCPKSHSPNYKIILD